MIINPDKVFTRHFSTSAYLTHSHSNPNPSHTDTWSGNTKALLPLSFSNTYLTWWAGHILLKFRHQNTSFRNRSLDFASFMDSEPILLAISTLWHPPLYPDLHPSWSLLLSVLCWVRLLLSAYICISVDGITLLIFDSSPRVAKRC